MCRSEDQWSGTGSRAGAMTPARGLSALRYPGRRANLPDLPWTGAHDRNGVFMIRRPPFMTQNGAS